jgi:two-component Ni(II)/redox sensor kinase NrsS
MNIELLFRRSRIRLALSYVSVMSCILGLSALGIYRSIIQSNWVALEQEIESIAGTLHDTLEPMLPISKDPTIVLQQIFPDLCLVDQSCNTNYVFAQRHTRGITDRNIYYIRLFDYHGKLIAFSPNQPSQLSNTLNSTSWQTIYGENGVRYRQFTTLLHSTDGHINQKNHSSWGYLQIGRTLISFDSETERIKWILMMGFLIALILVTISGGVKVTPLS